MKAEKSTDVLIKAIATLVSAGESIIQIRTNEITRAMLAVRQYVSGFKGCDYREWDLVSGMTQYTGSKDDLHVFLHNRGKPMTFADGINEPRNLLISHKLEKLTYFLYVNPQHHLSSPAIATLIQYYMTTLPATSGKMIFVTPDIPLEIPGLAAPIPSITFGVPTPDEVEEIITSTIQRGSEGKLSLNADDLIRAVRLSAGMTATLCESCVSVGYVEYVRDKQKQFSLAEHIFGSLMQGKTSLLNATNILELIKPEPMENVGGMGALKRWLLERAQCFSKEAEDYGLSTPRGLVLVGQPGAGKTSAARAIAHTLGYPLVKMDLGRVFAGLLGQSESNMRTALRMLEDIAPVINFIDEVDKGAAGIHGTGADSGASDRVLATLLSWLQDHNSSVFSVVTGNDISRMPAPLFRPGRFDAIMAVFLPTPKEREEVIRIHLRKRKRDANKILTNEDMVSLVSSTEGYSPSEIEVIVNNALIKAFTDGGREVTVEDLLASVDKVKPMSHSFRDNYEQIQEWCINNAISVSDPEEDGGGQAKSMKRIIRRNIRA